MFLVLLRIPGLDRPSQRVGKTGPRCLASMWLAGTCRFENQGMRLILGPTAGTEVPLNLPGAKLWKLV